MPSPQRPWRTRSPSRNWRSPGMIGRAGWWRRARGRRGRRRVESSSRARARRGSGRRAVGERLALRGEVARRPERLAGRRRAGPAAPLPVGRARRRGPASRSGSSGAPRRPGPGRGRVRLVEAAEPRPDHQLGRDLEQEPRRHGAWPIPHVARRQACDRNSRRLARVIPTYASRRSSSSCLLVVERPAVREQALLEPGDEHDRELEALRRVERDERHRVGVALVRVLVGDERGLLEQPVERVLRRRGRRSGS